MLISASFCSENLLVGFCMYYKMGGCHLLTEQKLWYETFQAQYNQTGTISKAGGAI
jgi:hypothetical protein